MHRIISVNALLPIALLFSCAAFYLFSHNSGYGYDALEYLVIGRSIAEGVPLYTYLPSKSPAIYYLIAGLYKLGVDFDHPSLAAVITAIYATTVTITYLIVRRWFDRAITLAVTGLTGAAAFFMELNFLQPTALFYLCGLLAFDSLLRFERSRNDWALFAAGLALGVGMAIKSSAAFYGVAAGHYLIWMALREKRSIAWLMQTGFVLGSGVMAVLLALLAYYWSQGNARAFIDWTLVFPISHYPSSTTYLDKAYTKLLWVNGFILGCVPLLLNRRLRLAALQHRASVLALLFGSCAYLALFKTQASHYYFPGAPFLFIFATSVYALKLRSIAISRRLMIAGASIAACLFAALGASVALYRPDAVRRLTTIKDFSKEEESMRTFIQSRVPQDRHVLITGGSIVSTWSYWVSHRYPPPPFINADVKTIWMLRNQPREVFKVLEHPLLTLVQFDPSQLAVPVLEDVFGERPEDKAIMREYLNRVRNRFQPAADSYAASTFWKRDDAMPATIAATTNDLRLDELGRR